MHLRTHSGERKFTCHVCSFRSLRKAGLSVHIIRRHGEESLKDNEAFLYQEKSKVKPYIPKQRKLVGPYRCSRCNIGYRHENSLTNHNHMYHQGKQSTVQYNESAVLPEPRTFFSIDFLQKIRHHRNIRVHSVVRDIPVECQECGKKLSSIAILQRHIEIKHPEVKVKPYFCIICKAKFKYNRHLNIHHMKMHAPSGRHNSITEICYTGTTAALPNANDPNENPAAQFIIGL